MPEEPAIRPWLENISDSSSEIHAIVPGEAPSRKRKTPQRPSPSLSIDESTEKMSSLSKKRKIDDPDPTPQSQKMIQDCLVPRNSGHSLAPSEAGTIP